MASSSVVEASSALRLDYDIPGWELSPEGFTVYLRVRSAYLHIHVEEQNFHRSPIALEAARMNKARFGSDSEEDEESLWEYLDSIATYFLPALEKIAPIAQRAGKLTLAEIGARQFYTSQLKFSDEAPYPGAISRTDPDTEHVLEDFNDSEQIPFESPFPRFQLSDVEVVVDDPSTVFDFIAGTVLVHGRTLFWKPTWMLPKPEEVVEKYRKIQQPGLPDDHLRTPRLYGVVVDINNVLRGLLYDWIDIEHGLTWDVIEKASIHVREKWATQLQNTVHTLHRIGVIWGDVKAENVVIDKHGDAIAIDFEGGGTRGWIDKDKMDTKDGDLQGLERLMNYIFDDGCHLRLRDKEMEEMEEMDCTE